MQLTHARLRHALRAAYHEAGVALGREVTDEMAVPSYLETGPLARSVFWGKVRHVIRLAQLKPETTVFDFGCGTGIMLPTLAEQHRTVMTTDLHPEIARCLVKHLSLGNVRFLDPQTWSDAVAAGTVETIIAANVLEHFDRRLDLLRRFGDKLTPTGRLVISGPTENRLYRLGRRLVGFSGDYHVSNVDDVFADAMHAGLRRVELVRFPLPGPGCLYKIAAYARGNAATPRPSAASPS